MDFDAVILAGGRSSRLGGVAKCELVIDGSTLLELAVRSTSGAREVVVVGDRAPDGVRRVREDPAYGGPVAAVAAGLAGLDEVHGDSPPEWVLMLACDMPLAGSILPRLLAAASDDGAVAVDPVGHPQYLLGVYRRSALGSALARLGRPGGRAVRELVDGLRLHEVSDEGAAGDLDTWADAARFGARPFDPR